jgi:hypothetical protein
MDQHAVIEFEDYPDEWTKVRIGGLTIREYEGIYDAANEAARAMSPEHLSTLREKLAVVLDSWSYDEPCDADGLRDRDPNWMLALAREWVVGVRRVPLPLPRRSFGTEASDTEDPSS